MKAANTVNLPIYFVGMDKATYPQEAAEQVAARTGGMAFVAETADTDNSDPGRWRHIVFQEWREDCHTAAKQWSGCGVVEGFRQRTSPWPLDA